MLHLYAWAVLQGGAKILLDRTSQQRTGFSGLIVVSHFHLEEEKEEQSRAGIRNNLCGSSTDSNI